MDDLSAWPGNQAGWPNELEGGQRCHFYGCEIEEIYNLPNGMLAGYCVRCSKRFEIAWFRGGSVAVLARQMCEEALAMESPGVEVLDHLLQVCGMLKEDSTILFETMQLAVEAVAYVESKSRHG